MANFNIQNTNSPAINYSLGLLPQRNQPHLWYQDTSCRSNLTDFSISSENRRIINKTTDFSHHSTSLAKFNFSPSIQKQLSQGLKYCYLGRNHSSKNGYYKRNMPGYEYYKDKKWVKYK